MSGPSNPVAGWYADPGDPASRLRYWDGATWTDHTFPRFEPEPPDWDQDGSPEDLGNGSYAEADPGMWPTPPSGSPAISVWQGAQSGQSSPDWQSAQGGPSSPSWQRGQSGQSFPAWQSGQSGESFPSWWSGQSGQSGPARQSGQGSPAWQGGPGSPAWQGSPGVLYPPAPPQTAKKSRTGLIVGGVIAAVVLVIAGLVVIALPTYERITGNTWFNGGVQGWPIIRVTNFPSNGATLLQAWKVPGPTVGPSKPFLQIAKLKSGPAPDETATQYLMATRQYLRTHGPGSGGLVTLNDGAPGLEWTRPTPLENAPGLAVTSFWLYAERGSSVYWIAFQTDSEDYASELPGVEAVMLNFKGTGH